MGWNFDCQNFPENARDFDLSRSSNSNFPLAKASISSLNVPMENLTSVKTDWFQEECIFGVSTLISDSLNNVPKCAFITSPSLYRNFFFSVFTGFIPSIHVSIRNRVFLWEYSFEKTFSFVPRLAFLIGWWFQMVLTILVYLNFQAQISHQRQPWFLPSRSQLEALHL